MHRRPVLNLLVLLANVVPWSPTHGQQRGRPVIDSSLGFNVIRTDQGTLLRGVSLAWNGRDPYGSLPKAVPTEAQLRRLAEEFGLNTVHLYLEGDSSQNPNSVGINRADADAFVQATADAGLYLVITIGCHGENGAIHSLAFAKDFWTLYGPRCRHLTHVIYEAHDEPALHTPSQWTIQDLVNPAKLTHLADSSWWGVSFPSALERCPDEGGRVARPGIPDPVRGRFSGSRGDRLENLDRLANRIDGDRLEGWSWRGHAMGKQWAV